MFGGGNNSLGGASSPERVVEGSSSRVAAPPTSSSAATKNLFLSTSEEEKLTKSLRHLLAEADSLRAPPGDHDVLGGLSALVDVDGGSSLSTLQDSDKQMTAALQLLRLNLQARNAAFDQNLHHLTKQLRLVTVATQDFATEQLASQRKTLEAKDEELALVKTEFEREKRKKKESATIYKELKERYDALWKQFEAGQDALLSQVDSLMHDHGHHDHGQRTGSRRSDRKRDGKMKGKQLHQVPAYLSQQSELRSAGVDEVLIFTTNDGATVTAWREFKFGGHPALHEFVKIAGNPNGELAKLCGMELVADGPSNTLGVGRSKRWAAIVQDGKVKWVAVSEKDDDPAGDDDPSKTMPDAVLAALKGMS
eukprot:g12210.t1